MHSRYTTYGYSVAAPPTTMHTGRRGAPLSSRTIRTHRWRGPAPSGSERRGCTSQTHRICNQMRRLVGLLTFSTRRLWHNWSASAAPASDAGSLSRFSDLSIFWVGTTKGTNAHPCHPENNSGGEEEWGSRGAGKREKLASGSYKRWNPQPRPLPRPPPTRFTQPVHLTSLVPCWAPNNKDETAGFKFDSLTHRCRRFWGANDQRRREN